MTGRHIGVVMITAALCCWSLAPGARADPAPLPTLGAGGAPVCKISSTAVLGRGRWPRRVLVAAHQQGGVVMWLAGKKARKLRVRRISREGQPAGAARSYNLSKMGFMRDLAATSTGYLLLYRTIIAGGSKFHLGTGKPVMTLWLRAFSTSGKPVGPARKVLDGRMQTTAYLQSRGDKTQILVSETMSPRRTRYRLATVGPTGEVGPYKEVQGNYGPSALGPHWPKDTFLYIYTYWETRGDKHPFFFYRKHRGKLLGKPLALPLDVADFYRRTCDRNGDCGLDIEDPFEKPFPGVAWNGQDYFVAAPVRIKKNRFTQKLFTISCP